jgi:hypothetical protein
MQMKTQLLALCLASMCVGSSHAVTHTLSGPLDVFQATTNPENVGSGSGSIVGSYDAASNTLDYSIEWMGLTSDVTNMHFHLGAPGVAGGVELGIPGPWSSPQVGSGIVISDANETNLLAGDWYVNVHTAQFVGGEIRGQVILSQIPEPGTGGLAATAALPLWMVYRRRVRRD